PIALSCLVLMAVSAAAETGPLAEKKARKAAQRFDLRVTTSGPTKADVDAVKLRVEQSPAVRSALKNGKYRLLSLEYTDGGDHQKKAAGSARFRATFYSYSDDVAVIAEGDFAGREPITAVPAYFDPGVGDGELDEAFAIIRADARFKSTDGKLALAAAMPPVSNVDGERLINIRVIESDTAANEIVGVSFKNSRVVRYAGNAPPAARATPEACGISDAGQPTTFEGSHPGQYQLTASQGGNPLWEMLVLRPNVSSGAPFERSGIEIRDVKYKGKSVLKRGHVPVLNVKYVNASCGPYRDWQYQEGFFSIPPAGVSFPNGADGGFAILPEGQVATTSVESRNDQGNFRGVAVYQQVIDGVNELVLVTEMEAGWYRYIMEWRFGADGIIRPRYGFGSTTSSCVCVGRDHHVYWRLDFDVVSPVNRIFQVERGRKFMRPIATEAAIFRNYATNRGFVIQSGGNEAYSIFPGITDGSVADAAGNVLDPFGGGDFWLMQFKGTAGAPIELNDPNVGTVAATLGPFINGESIAGQDVVVWYGAHQRRIDDASRPGTPEILAGKHVVGPEIRPIQW
ncbi:MAG TPA: hypothetical protein VNA17_04195, partial [Pyrinomonadaceae bacterium]|nr:hypothetical protein [Pyrinomonadaceae bacterium]